MITLVNQLKTSRPTAQQTSPVNRQAMACLHGLGSVQGAHCVTNVDFEQELETTDEWIRSRTGIASRRFAAEHQTTTTLAIDAASLALEDAGTDPSDIDLVIVATATPDDITPSTAARVQSAIRALNAAAFDVSAACSGFIYAAHMASGFVKAGMYRKVLVIGAETLSRRLDMTDRSTAVLFGDGAGAAIIGAGSANKGLNLVYTSIGSDGAGADLIRVPNAVPHASIEDRWIRLDGRRVFKAAVRRMADEIIRATESLGINLDDLGRIIPHQANQRILEAVAETLGVDPSRIYSCVQDTANTSSASIPIAMERSLRERPVEVGEFILTVAFGSGLTWGCQVWRRE